MKRFLLILLLLASYFCKGQINYKIVVPKDYSECPLDEFIHFTTKLAGFLQQRLALTQIVYSLRNFWKRLLHLVQLTAI